LPEESKIVAKNDQIEFWPKPNYVFTELVVKSYGAKWQAWKMFLWTR